MRMVAMQDSGIAELTAWLARYPALEATLVLAALVAAAWLADVLAKRLLVRWINRLARRTRATWDDALRRRRVFGRLALIVPAGVLYYGFRLVPGLSSGITGMLEDGARAAMVFVLLLALSAALSAANDIYEQFPVGRTRPIKGYVQVMKIGMWVVGSVVVVATAVGQSPLFYLSGLGAMTAVLLLVFKDTILSLVASVQISQTDLLRVGDWIEMPQVGADGDVVDVSLYTVTVQNWDKTVTPIPTHRFLTEAFRNWRSMPESGGRRVKRAIYLAKDTIRFLTEEEIAHFKRFKLLEEYLAHKEEELRAYNAALGMTAEHVNLRRLTNAGTFRAYVVNYLRHHPRVRHDMTLLVRQLQPTAEGLPLELYFFTSDTEWAAYEGIQADIFDHLMAIVPEFGLRVFQAPSGTDVRALAAGPTRRTDAA